MVSSIAASTDPVAAVRELRELWHDQTAINHFASGSHPSVGDLVDASARMLEMLKAEEKKPLVHHITACSASLDLRRVEHN